MPRYCLEVKATLENISNFYFTPEADLFVQFECISCHEKTENFLALNASYQVSKYGGGNGNSGSGISATNNLIFKCKFCKKEGGSCDLIRTAKYTASSNLQWTVMAELECRGFTPVAFSWRNDGSVQAKGKSSIDADPEDDETSSKGFLFEDVELEENDEWYSFDEILNIPVSITEVKMRFQKQ